MKPIQGLYYTLAAKSEIRDALLERANNPDAEPRDAHTNRLQAALITKEIYLLQDAISSAEHHIELVEAQIGMLAVDDWQSAARTLVRRELEVISGRLRRELGDLVTTTAPVENTEAVPAES